MQDGLRNKNAFVYAAAAVPTSQIPVPSTAEPSAAAAAVYYAGRGNSTAVMGAQCFGEDEIEARKAEVRLLDQYYTFLENAFKDDKQLCKLFMDSLKIQRGGNELRGTLALPVKLIISLLMSKR